MFKRLKFIVLKTIEYYKRKSGKPIVDYTKGCGYYLHLGIINHDPKGEIHEIDMESGKIMLAKLLEYKTFFDPSDMVKSANYQFIGYKGEKKITELTLFEYLRAFQLINKG